MEHDEAVRAIRAITGPMPKKLRNITASGLQDFAGCHGALVDLEDHQDLSALAAVMADTFVPVLLEEVSAVLHSLAAHLHHNEGTSPVTQGIAEAANLFWSEAAEYRKQTEE